MKTRLKTTALARVAGAALLLSAALAAWGVSVTLDDGTNTITCTISTGGSIGATGDITTNVVSGCIPAGGGGGGGGGGGTGPFTLSVLKSGPNAGPGTVASADSAISCGATCSASLASATPVSLTAATGTGTFAGWSGGGCTGTGTCAFSISANTTVTAVFGPLNLTVTKAGTGAGTVTNGTIINCDAALTDCSESFNTVSSVVLTAAPAGGSTFAGWSGGGCSGTAPTCTVNMNDNKTVTATFNVASACGTQPADVTVVDTGNLNVEWRQQTFFPLPQTITAFKVTAPAGFAGHDTFSAIKTSAASRSKRLVVSTCPGVLTPVNGQSACNSVALENTSISVSLNSADPSYYCKLTPGATYYVNAVSKVNLTDTTYTCTNTTNCSFSASRSAPF
ncbi:MAG: hypothetical protein WBN82_06490 [Porticoccaceae bacterium]